MNKQLLLTLLLLCTSIKTHAEDQWDIFEDMHKELSTLHAKMEQLSKRMADDMSMKELAPKSMEITFHEKEKELIATVALEGIDKDSINIDITDNILRLSAEKKESKETKEKCVHERNVSYARLELVRALSCEVDPSNTMAKIKDGVLTITMPKLKTKSPIKIVDEDKQEKTSKK
jgi:HSP20 family protein